MSRIRRTTQASTVVALVFLASVGTTAAVAESAVPSSSDTPAPAGQTVSPDQWYPDDTPDQWYPEPGTQATQTTEEQWYPDTAPAVAEPSQWYPDASADAVPVQWYPAVTGTQATPDQWYPDDAPTSPATTTTELQA